MLVYYRQQSSDGRIACTWSVSAIQLKVRMPFEGWKVTTSERKCPRLTQFCPELYLPTDTTERHRGRAMEVWLLKQKRRYKWANEWCHIRWVGGNQENNERGRVQCLTASHWVGGEWGGGGVRRTGEIKNSNDWQLQTCEWEEEEEERWIQREWGDGV